MKIPGWTLLICAIATVVYFVPWLSDELIFDRQSIRDGEWWRLVSCSLVHLSGKHLIFDVLGLLVVGSIPEVLGVRYLWLVYLFAGTTSAVVVYLSLPNLQLFGGLSGVATAAMIYSCLHGLEFKGAWRWWCLVLMTLVIIKIGVEFVLGISILLETTPQPFVPVPASHLAGALTALLVYSLAKCKVLSNHNKKGTLVCG